MLPALANAACCRHVRPAQITATAQADIIFSQVFTTALYSHFLCNFNFDFGFKKGSNENTFATRPNQKLRIDFAQDEKLRSYLLR